MAKRRTRKKRASRQSKTKKQYWKARAKYPAKYDKFMNLQPITDAEFKTLKRILAKVRKANQVNRRS